jgi:hypothetical protein
MRASRILAGLGSAGALVGLIFVSPALSSRGPVQRVDVPPTRPVSGMRPRASRPAVETRSAALDCVKVRRSLFVEGEGWIVRRVSICR